MRILIVAVILFFFALSIRLWNFGDAGRWSDEQGIMEHGYRMIKLVEQKDFTTPFWYTTANDHPPFVYYLYGLTSYFDFIRYDMQEPVSWGVEGSGSPIFHYDLLSSRLISIITSALCVVLVFLIAIRYFSFFTGIMSAVILAMMPHFVGYAHYVNLENVLTLFYSLCIFTYLLYLEKQKRFWLILTGILIGINLMIKESNVLILIFFPVTYFAWKRITKNNTLSYKHFFVLLITALLTCFVLWPMIWFHPVEYWSHIWSLWLGPTGNTPDVFLGKLMGAHIYYYVVTFLITTPLLILLLTFTGITISWKERKNWIYVALIIWFLVPFLISFFHHRQHMIRYIVQCYVPLSILAALGFEFIIRQFTKNNVVKYFMLLPIIFYMAYILFQASPYYFTYFNELVGGTKNVYEKRLFLIGWYGDGIKNPGMYLAQTAKPNASVGVAIDPFTRTSVYRVPSLHYEQFDPKKEYDYVIVNYYSVIRLGFDESQLQQKYERVYTEKASGIDYVSVYKHK